MNKKILAITTLLLMVMVAFWFTSGAVTARATSPSPLATPKLAVPVKIATPEASILPALDPEQATQNIKDRIDKALESGNPLNLTPNSTNSRRGFIAEVQRLSEKTVTVRSRRGTESFVITPEVSILKDTTPATIDDIAVGDWLTMMGVMQGEEFNLRRVIISPKSLVPTKFSTVIGSLTKSEKTQLTFQTKQGSSIILTTKTTVYEDPEHNPIKRENLQLNTQFVIVAKSENNSLTAVLVHSMAPAQ